MPDEAGYMPITFQPTAARPLLGLTVLVVEDSRFASEAVRLLSIRSGARIRRADSIGSANRHLQVYRPSIAVIDLGLPDGSGLDLIKMIAASDSVGRPIIIATTGADGENQEQVVLEAGADAFLPKPIASIAAFQNIILQHLPEDRRPRGPRLVRDEIISPDPLALHEDLAHLEDLLSTGNETLSYAVPFLQGLARLSEDMQLKLAADSLSDAMQSGTGISSAVKLTQSLIHDRVQERASNLTAV